MPDSIFQSPPAHMRGHPLWPLSSLTCLLLLQPNYFSAGGQPGQPRPNCKPCGLHFHSPAGSMSAEYCECDIGYGADPEDDHRCVPCALGTFNPGSPQMQLAHHPYQSAAVTVAASAPAKKDKALHTPVAKACQRCGAAHPDGVFTTLQSGSISAADCVCLPGYGGSSCSACPAVSTRTLVARVQLCCEQRLKVSVSASMGVLKPLPRYVHCIHSLVTVAQDIIYVLLMRREHTLWVVRLQSVRAARQAAQVTQQIQTQQRHPLRLASALLATASQTMACARCVQRTHTAKEVQRRSAR